MVAALITGYILLPLRGNLVWLGALVGLVAIVGTVPLAVRRVQAVRDAEHPVLVAIEALVLLVTMLIVGFAAVYFAVDSRHDQFAGLETRHDAVYFTVTTMATVGYGDIHPIGQAARALAVAQMLLNLVFLGIVVRVLARAARGAEGAND